MDPDALEAGARTETPLAGEVAGCGGTVLGGMAGAGGDGHGGGGFVLLCAFVLPVSDGADGAAVVDAPDVGMVCIFVLADGLHADERAKHDTDDDGGIGEGFGAIFFPGAGADNLERVDGIFELDGGVEQDLWGEG